MPRPADVASADLTRWRQVALDRVRPSSSFDARDPTHMEYAFAFGWLHDRCRSRCRCGNLYRDLGLAAETLGTATGASDPWDVVCRVWSAWERQYGGEPVDCMRGEVTRG